MRLPAGAETVTPCGYSADLFARNVRVPRAIIQFGSVPRSASILSLGRANRTALRRAKAVGYDSEHVLHLSERNAPLAQPFPCGNWGRVRGHRYERCLAWRHGDWICRRRVRV